MGCSSIKMQIFQNLEIDITLHNKYQDNYEEGGNFWLSRSKVQAQTQYNDMFYYAK